MDITLAITRTGIFVATYSLVLGIPFAIAFSWETYLRGYLGDHWWMVPLITSTVFSTAGPFIYLYIQRRAEDKLLQEQRQYQSTLRKASLGMGRVKDLKRLLDLIVYVVARTVKIDHCAVYLLHEESKQFILKASKNKNFRSESNSMLMPGSKLLEYIGKTKEPVVYEEIKQRSQDYGDDFLSNVEKEMLAIEAALAVPSYIEDRLIAIIILGKKLNSKLYTQDDLVVFSILANQSALAIENAQFYEDVKKTHEQLFKAEKMATIGTMADGLSHQINNRLHAMGFISGDALDAIRSKKKDTIPADIQPLLTEIEEALARIQDNVKRGGEIVEGLLKYTRKGEEGFSPIDLTKLVNASVEMVQYKIKMKEFTLLKSFGSDVPNIRGNFTQLQEVFFNIIDNAYDAMMQRKADLKEPGYRPQLEVKAFDRGKHLEIIFEDNGIGVKKEDMHKIFTPFFTTKLSSKKGTGLGMYVIRQIIEVNHGGHVDFIAEFGRGSRTTITLPLMGNG